MLSALRSSAEVDELPVLRLVELLAQATAMVAKQVLSSPFFFLGFSGDFLIASPSPFKILDSGRFQSI